MSTTLRRAAKRTAAEVLWRLGVPAAVARVRLRRQVIVLTYHRVLPDDTVGRSWSSAAMTVSASTFDRHLETLRSVFTPLTLEQFVDHVHGRRTSDEPACLVTFDDGWWDTLDAAAPLLRKHEVPAVVFVPVDCLGSPDGFWQERLGRQLYEVWNAARRGTPSAQVIRILAEYELSDVLTLEPGGVRDDIRAVVARVKGRGGELARELVRRLGEVSGPVPGDDIDRLLDRDGVRRLAASGVAIGGHGATHRVLTELTPSQAAEEARRCMSELRALLGAPVLAYSYPNGNWNPEIAAATRAAGFSVAFTTTLGRVPAGDHRQMSLPRINIHEGSAGTPAMFLARAVGLL